MCVLTGTFGRKNVECRARAPRTGSHLRVKALELERLKNLLSDVNLFGSVSTRTRCQRDPNGVTDAFGQQNRKCRRAGNDSFGAEAGFCESKMKRVVGASGPLPIYLAQI